MKKLSFILLFFCLITYSQQKLSLKNKPKHSFYLGAGVSNELGIKGTGAAIISGFDLDIGNTLFVQLGVDLFTEPDNNFRYTDEFRFLSNFNCLVLHKNNLFFHKVEFSLGGGVFYLIGSAISVGLIASLSIDYHINELMYLGYNVRHPYYGTRSSGHPLLLNSIFLRFII